jgi:xylose isomerase
MCKTRVITVDADTFYANLKGLDATAASLKAAGKTGEEIDMAVERRIADALNNSTTKVLKKGEGKP